MSQCFTDWLINALCVPRFVLLYSATHFYNRRILPLLTPIDFVEQNPFAVTIKPVASGLVKPTPISEKCVKQILALVAILVITAAVSARRFPFAFATSAYSLSFWFWFWPWLRRSRTGGLNSHRGRNGVDAFPALPTGMPS